MNSNILNLPLTVTQLNNQVKTSLYQQYQNIDIVGEIMKFHKHSSGHVYFTLKDNTSRISCVMFNAYHKKININVKDGDKVILSGEVTLYLPSGSYQFATKKIKLLDEKGSIYKEYEKLKKQLNSEGLFREECKKKIPHFPTKVGIVTSLDGAVIKDISNISIRRSRNVDLILSHSSVQGINAPNQVIGALDKLIEYNKRNKIDIIIIARGGGSFEDLNCFNDELLARKVFSIDIPVISAIGHETDFTILDFVSDLRASTPSEAAELSIPDDYETFQSLDLIADKILNRIGMRINSYKDSHHLFNSSLKQFNPKFLIESYKTRLLSIEDKINNLQKNIYNNVDDKIQYYNKLLYHNNPYNILNKGFVVISNKNNKFIKKVKDVDLNDQVQIQFQDGSVEANIQSINKKNEKK